MSSVRLFLCGDVMTGRGLDQILPCPGDPTLHESYVKSAIGYVELAERVSGEIPRPVTADYPWGAALAEWDRMAPDVRLANLETAVTRSEAFAPKGINYRMTPENAACLTAAGLDACVLANNHVLDFGVWGLRDTLETLDRLGVSRLGAGRDLAEAAAPIALPIAQSAGRLILAAAAFVDSGVPPGWAARPGAPGVNLVDPTAGAAAALARSIAELRRPGDIGVVSLHWGSNWGYEVPAAHQRFAHALIDSGEVSVVHGHSSHHPRPIEVYRDRLILYGCGDFLNDYEGIDGYEPYRGDLVAMYFADLDPASGALQDLVLTPLTIRRFRLERASAADAAWLAKVLTRESAPYGVRLETTPSGPLMAAWAARSGLT